jgi:putative ATP-dependent endonuclease of OLD family
VFLDNDNNIENQLLKDGFQDEIRQALIELDDYHSEQEKTSAQVKIKAFNDEKLYKQMKKSKTQFAPVIAEQIIKSKKTLPPKIIELFNKISSILNITEKAS